MKAFDKTTYKLIDEMDDPFELEKMKVKLIYRCSMMLEILANKRMTLIYD